MYGDTLRDMLLGHKHKELVLEVYLLSLSLPFSVSVCMIKCCDSRNVCVTYTRGPGPLAVSFGRLSGQPRQVKISWSCFFPSSCLQVQPFVQRGRGDMEGTKAIVQGKKLLYSHCCLQMQCDKVKKVRIQECACFRLDAPICLGEPK